MFCLFSVAARHPRSRCRRYPHHTVGLTLADHVAVAVATESSSRRRHRGRTRATLSSDEGHDELALSALIACLAGSERGAVASAWGVTVCHGSCPPDCIPIAFCSEPLSACLSCASKISVWASRPVNLGRLECVRAFSDGCCCHRQNRCGRC